MAPTPEARPDRPVVAPVAEFRLAEQVARLKQEPAWISGSRNAITLVKEPALRVVLTVLKKGARLEEHQAGGPLTFQVLSGSVRLGVADRGLEVRAGGLIILRSALAHTVEALEESAFLLTLVQPGEARGCLPSSGP